MLPKYIARSATIGCVASTTMPKERNAISGTLAASTTSRDIGAIGKVRTTGPPPSLRQERHRRGRRRGVRVQQHQVGAGRSPARLPRTSTSAASGRPLPRRCRRTTPRPTTSCARRRSAACPATRRSSTAAWPRGRRSSATRIVVCDVGGSVCAWTTVEPSALRNVTDVWAWTACGLASATSIIEEARCCPPRGNR